ncbi:RUS family member 1 [Venturia canescens]|uniref:RUS family member 1 n=1 Tax=Venturia canescens TaxID=32260 RepID=UPI001C9D2E65|nr:RUS family member 1 [Venturia canescens]
MDKKQETSDFSYTKIRDGDKTGLVLCENNESDSQFAYLKKTQPTDLPIFSTSVEHFLKDVFLPRGFPDSVHSDYVQYQIWDTVQAFASTILGTLTTHSIMRGVGVGESTATPLAAAITWILKDGTGMVGRIVFAWWNGPGLDAQCKKWRLFADVLNDAAMGIELTLPYFPSFSTILLCFSSAMKSLVGVAGGATRASITQHQALQNNLADVSAKDGSQETCVNLIASLVGVFMLSFLGASSHVLFWYVVLVATHIYANYRAVRSLCFDTLNEDRLAIIVDNYLMQSSVLSPEKVNEQESVLISYKASKKLCGFDITIGESLEDYVESAKSQKSNSSSIRDALTLFRITKSSSFSIFGKRDRSKSLHTFFIDMQNRVIRIALVHDATSENILNSYISAFLMGIMISMGCEFRQDIIEKAKNAEGPLLAMYKMAIELRQTLSQPKFMNGMLDQHTRTLLAHLKASEWKMDTSMLLVGPYRIYEDTKMLLK